MSFNRGEARRRVATSLVAALALTFIAWVAPASWAVVTVTAAPVNTVLPVFSGTAAAGQTVSVTSGTWDDKGDASPSTTYQWQESSDGITWSSVSGANSSSFVIPISDIGNKIRAQVTRTNTQGSTTANSILTATTTGASSMSSYGTITTSNGSSTGNLQSSGGSLTNSSCNASNVFIAVNNGWWTQMLTTPVDALQLTLFNDNAMDDLIIYTAADKSTSVTYTPTSPLAGYYVNQSISTAIKYTPSDVAHRAGANVNVNVPAPAGKRIYGYRFDWGTGFVISTTSGANDCRGLTGTGYSSYPTIVAGVPSAPQSVTTTSAATSITFNWSAPASNGGSAIMSYKVTSSPGSFTCTATSTTSCTVTGLTTGTAYTFSVIAINAAGNGAATTVSATPLPNYTLTYSVNGGSGTAPSSQTQTTGGQSLTVASQSGLTRSGFVASGWNTAADGSGTTYNVGASITPASNTTLYAMWHRQGSTPICAAGVGQGGPGTSNYLTTGAGDGCVVIKYVSGGSTIYETFNYTGSTQSWTVPSDVTNATFYLIGAGGGGGIYAGGGGGFATGSYSVTAGDILSVIVGQGGGGVAGAAVTGYVGKYTPLTYGGGGRGGSYGGASGNWFGSGGGRSAIRLPSASTDLVTAAGGGGGSYSQCGFGGGGTSGLPAVKSANSGTGGTQTAGGTGGPSGNGYPGTDGSAYQGGDSKDEGGGGGGGYFGGGGGGDNYGGGGGSSYIALLTSGATAAGANCGATGLTTGLSYVVTYDPNNATSGSAPGNTTVALAGQTLTLASNSGNLARSGYTFAGWNTQADGSGTNYVVSATSFPISGDVTLYAQWNSVITYNSNSATSGSVPATQTIVGNATATLAGNTGTLAKTNFTFSGWNTASDGRGTNYPASQTGYVASGNATLYAQWNSVITFHVNGATGAASSATISVNPSSSVPLATVGTMAKSGSTFIGWNTAANLSGTFYPLNSANYQPNGNITLYAQWAASCSPTTSYISGYIIQTFATTGTCAWTVPAGVTSIDELLVGGGAGGANGIANYYWAEGGGGGEVISLTGVSVTPSTVHGVVVGAGGANATNGGSSYFDTSTAQGGLTGNATTVGNAGAYGGTSGNGNLGGNGGANGVAGCATGGCGAGGGGGAGSAGSGLNGGTGVSSSITGTAQRFGGGGAGRNIVNATGSSTDGGGAYATAGTANSGGGGGGAAAGGSGLVIIRYSAQFTVTFNVNGGTGSPSVASVTQSSPSAAVTLATAGTLAKAGLNPASWNTAADGSGIAYGFGAVMTPTSPITLYAQYLSTCASTTTYSGGYTIQTFSTTGLCYWAQPSGVTSIDSLIVGGGGGAASNIGGGGGGGQVISSTNTTLSGPLVLSIGAGGAGGTGYYNSGVTNGQTGQSSYIFDGTNKTIALPGNGGRGRFNSSNGVTTGGYTGGGAAYPDTGYATSATPNTGSGGSAVDGGASDLYGGGGGGGAGGAGNSRANNSAGGVGVTSSITGTSTYYGGGGGGAKYGGSAVWTGAGGLGGGGQGSDSLTRATSGTNGLGGGGGSDYAGSYGGGAGGSGVVIIRYASKFTVTFDANGGTGTASSATVTQSAFGASITLATAGTLARTGYTLTGWNTAADGTGTGYSLGATYTPATPITLYAVWTGITYSVTYHANGATTGSVPSPGSYTTGGSVYQIAGNTGNLALGSYSFGGWNSASNISGTTYAPGLSGLPTPIQHLEAPNYNATTKTWTDSSGAATPLNIPSSRVLGTPTLSTNTANTNGSTKSFTYVSGSTAAGMKLGNVQLANYTFCAVARYTGGTNRRIFNADSGNWLTGWYDVNHVGMAFHEGWLAGGTTATSADTNWHVDCDYGANLRWDGVQGGTGGGVTYMPPMTINYSASNGETSDWAVADVIMFNSTLTLTQIQQIEAYYKNYYGLTAVSSTTPAGLPTYSTPANLDLYAIWNSTITYNANGSTGGTAPAAQLDVGSAATTLAANSGTLAKTNFTFGGWNTAADGSGTSYPASSAYTPTGNITLYAQWNSVLTFNTNGAASGSPSISSITDTGTATVLLPTVGSMIKTGFSFLGWSASSTSSTATYLPGASYVSTGTTTLYAIWSANSYAITFNTNGATGSMANEAIVAGTAKALTTNTLTRTGYTFTGWNTLAAGGGTAYADAASVTLYGNLTLYAQWLAGTYTLNYGGNYIPQMGSKSFTAGTPFALPTMIWTRSGYTFAGWSDASLGAGVHTVLYTDGQTVTLYAYTQLYDQWTPNVYVVSYSANGGTGAPSAATQNYTFGSAAITSFPTVGTMAKTGYSFGGWSTTASGTTALTTLTPAASQTVYAIWTPQPQAVTFNGNGSTSGSMTNQSISAGTATALTANSFSRTGYSFAGWNSSADGTGTTSYTNSQSVTIYAPMTIYAQWAILAPSVPTISVSGGNTTATISITSSETNTATAGAPNSYTVTAYSGTTASGTCTVIPVATSCIITGLANGTAYTFKAVATNTTGSATSLASAAVTPAPYTVTYNAGSVGTVTTTSANTTYNAGTPVTLPTPTAAGYTFTGWYSAATGGSFVGSPNSSYSPASSTTLYATWTANTYTISYDANGGTGTTPSNGSYQTGGTVYPIAAGTGISKAGYDFTAWNTAIDGTGTTYTPPVNYSTPAALTLYAKWTAIFRTITYAANGGTGTVPTQTSLIIGQTFTVASGSALSKANYTFGGWSDGTNIYLAGATYTIATSNVTLTAQWTPVQYVVTYAANGGTGSAPVDVTHAATTTVTVLGVGSLTRDGYSFAGWSDGTTTYQASNTFSMPASNITLTAQWSPATFTITYSNNTGTGSASRTTDSFLNGSPAIGLPTIGTLAKAGYTFAGWSDTNTVTATAIVGSYAPTKSITLYAVWSPGTYAITYNANGASGSPTGATTSYTTGTTGVTLPSATGMTKSGYTLSGWSLTPTGSVISGAFAPTTDTTIYAIWAPASISVSYVANISATSGAVAIPPSGTKVFGTSFNIPAPDSATVTNSTGDYAFAGWFDGTSIYNANASYLMGASPVTFTAQWVKIYTLHYVLNGGVAVTAGDFDDHQYINNQTVNISASAPRRDGYSFNGWLDQSNTSVAQGASNFVIGDTHYILTAQWTAVSYAITYNSDGGSAVSGSTTVSGTYGSTVRVADAPTKTGYTFLGWSDTHATYGAGTSYIMPAAPVTFTALWSANLYHVTFDLNGGTSTAITQSDTAYQGTFTIPSTVPTKTGYTFTHWLYNSTNYDPSAAFLMPNNSVTFVAQWSVATYSVTYSLNGGTSTLPTQSDVAFGSTFTTAATPTYASRTFLGWNDGTTTYGAGATYTMGTSAVTLTAVWSGATYAVSYGLSGGTGTIPTAQLSASPGTVTLAGSTGFSKSGFTFSTWSDGTTSYAAGSSFSVPTHNTSLIAVWVVALPVTPTAPTAVAGNGQATITLGSPAASGGGAVATYTITASPGGATCTVTSPATSCIITGLTNGTPYTFTSTATNSTGSSSASPASSSVTPATIPDYPANITAVPGNRSAIVSWSPPANNGGSPILSYTVTATSGQTCTVNAPATTCTITGLTNGVPVDFVLTATNAVGTSLPSPDPTITPANVPGAPASVSATAASGTTASVTVGAATDNGGNAITNYTITANSSTGATVTTTVTAAQIANPVLMTGLTPGSAYTFTAVATNQVGSGTGTTSSSVTQPAVAPSAPTISSATASSTTAAAITVTAPTSNGGAAISGYVATLTPVGGGAPVTLTTNTSSTSLSVTGLNPGTTYTVAVAAKNSAGNSPASSTTTFTTPLGVSTSVATLSATYGTPITPITTALSAASPTGATYSVSPTLPAGLTLNTSTGVISGTPTAAVSSSTFTISVSATVSGGAISTGSATVSIGVAAILPTAPATVYATVINSSSASVRITAPSSNGGSPITKYTITATPVGGGSAITQDASSISSPVVLTGLTDTTNYTISVTATNGVGTGPSTTMTGSITTPTPSPTITSVSPTTGSGAGGTSVTITGTNLIQGSSPTAVTFDGNPCTITGTPTSTSITCTTPADAPGPADVVVTTPDSQQVTAAAAFTYYAPVSATTALATKAIEVGVAVAAFTPVTAAGGIAPITYAIAPSLPAGLSFNTSTGAITGTLTAPSGTSTFVITATDSTSPTPESSSSSFTLTGNPALSALGSTTPVSLTAGVPATPFTPVTVSNGVAPVTYSVSPALPAGLTLNPATGQITGTAISAVVSGTYTITATDAAGGTSHADFTLEVAPGPLTANTSVASTSATQNSAITPFTPVTVAGGTAPFTYSVSPALPAGLTLDPATGRISGTPTEILAVTTFTLTATDSGSPAQSVSSTFTLGVVAAPVAPTPAPAAVVVRVPTQVINSTPTPLPTYSYTKKEIVQAKPRSTPSARPVSPSPSAKPSASASPRPTTSTDASHPPLSDVITLDINFDMGSSLVKGANLTKLKALAKVLSGLGKSITITVKGYAQPTPGTEKSDQILCANRAEAVAKLLKSLGVNTQIRYLGAGRAKLNTPASRYVEIIASNS